jgi:hypothetical protein
VRFTICQDPADLPARRFEYLCIIGGNAVPVAIRLAALPALVDKNTRIILVENDHDQAFQALQDFFPNQVSKGWAIGDFTIPNHSATPIRVRVEPVPAMFFEAPSDESLTPLQAFVSLLRKAGLLLTSFATRKACTRSVACVRVAGVSIRASTTFVDLGVEEDDH